VFLADKMRRLVLNEKYMRYRSEIDGLRALAVMPVIFFHAGISGFSGGYVGVDVFFVISGYLITSILISDLENNRFSLAVFYERRARRILPALFFMLALSAVLAIWLMQPADMIDFSEALIFVPLFISNFLFYGKDGYFDAAMESSPVFHTWSLAVEEQYYLLVPLLLMALWKFAKHHLFFAFLSLSIVSLFLAELVVVIDPMLAFFHLPFRFWELGMGSLIAVAERNGSLNVRNVLANVLAALGLIMVGYSVTAFDSLTPTPSVMTLIPVLGSALIIGFSGNAKNTYKTVVAKVLSFKFFVGLGLISYSAYLLHQPLLAFVRIYRFDNMNNGVIAKVVIATLAIAFLSWRFIEKPFRDKTRFSTKPIFISALVASLIFILVGLVGIQSDGFKSFYESRLSKEERLFFKNANELIENRRLGLDAGEVSGCGDKAIQANECQRLPVKPLVVFGDSHASNVISALKQSEKMNNIARKGSGTHCHPYHIHDGSMISSCNFEEVLKDMQENGDQYSGFVFNQLGAYFLRDEKGAQLNHIDIGYVLKGGELFLDKERIHRNLDYLNEISKSLPTIWLAPWLEPRYPMHLPRKMVSYGLENIKFHPTLIEGFKAIDEEAMDYIKENNLNVKYVTLYDYEKNKNWIDIFEGDCATFNDKDHLSLCGQSFAAEIFAEKLSKALEN